MHIYLKEKIGLPELFTGRKRELAFFQKWIEGTKKEISQSMAILSRRKTGKTAILQRLYNLTFEKNDGVIPFYYEMREGPRWAVDFCRDFYLTFVWQYLAFHTRKPEYLVLRETQGHDFAQVAAIAEQEHLEYLIGQIHMIEKLVNENNVDTLWRAVREAPLSLATQQNERIVQIIDEFQYLNSEIYLDQAKTHHARNFAGGYMSTAEYKNAPLLVSGSWVGWLREMLHTLLPSRFRQYELENMPEDEALEMIYKYAQIMEIPVIEDVVYAMAQVCEGNPFYISALFHSHCPDKDFTTQEGLLHTLEFETLNDQGNIKGVWMEYIGKIFYNVNERYAKQIVLYLCQHRDREVTRKELLDMLKLDMTDFELEHKLHDLVKSDIIEQGHTNFDYRGVQDNIFDKIFRGVYQKEIEHFDPREITQEYKLLYEQAQREYQSLLGKYNQTKGLFAEFAIINQLRLHAFRQQEFFRAITHNLPRDFAFVEYEHVWSYKTARADKRDIQIDLFARAPSTTSSTGSGQATSTGSGQDSGQAYSLIGEVKNRDTKAFSRAEAEKFVRKAQQLRELEQVEKAVLFVFSRHGFTQEALAYFREQHIAWSDDERWLG